MKTTTRVCCNAYAAVSPLVIALFVLSSLLPAKLFALDIIKVNAPLSASDTRYDYTHELLQKILRITTEDFGPARIEVSYRKESRQRALSSLTLGVELHVMAEAPKPSWDSQLLSVNIPIRKGLQGYRLFLIHRDSQVALEQIKTLEDLTALSTGSGTQWSTLTAMQQAGFPVVTSNSYNGLFKMLSSKRFTTFARGINEAYQELEHYREQRLNLTVDQSLLLYLPLPTYFYVTPTQPALRQRIETGLLRLIDSGEFDRFFFSQHCPDLIRANIAKRTLFNIANPNIHHRPLSQNPKHWLNINQDFSLTCTDYMVTDNLPVNGQP